jgi:hypothetical protein
MDMVLYQKPSEKGMEGKPAKDLFTNLLLWG